MENSGIDNLDEHKYMLTVEKLIDYLKKQNPKAFVLGFEINSNAYIHQIGELPSLQIRTVAEEKISELEHLKHWFKGCENSDEKVEKEMKEIFRYSKDDDIVMNFQ